MQFVFLFFNNSRCDHLLKGIVFAFTGRTDVHQCGADLLLLESCFQQMGNLCLLKEKGIIRPAHNGMDIITAIKNCVMRLVTHLEHFVDVIIFLFQQITPGSEITVCEHTAGLQQSVSMTLRTRFSQHNGVWSLTANTKLNCNLTVHKPWWSWTGVCATSPLTKDMCHKEYLWLEGKYMQICHNLI